MPGRPLSPPRVPAINRVLLVLIAVACLAVSLMSPISAAAAPGQGGVQAGAEQLSGSGAASLTSADAASVDSAIAPATLVGFKPGNIISDAVLTNKSTMTEAQIQAFFDSKVARCQGGSDSHGPIVCLKDFKITSVNRPADAYCSGYTGAANESAARIIHRVAQACNINPQVLIVMLQKEQGLVTHTWPSAWRYDKALGQGCPDDAPCNPAFVGFFHQIYGAARQLQIYMENKYFTWYAPGKTWNILYHPNRECGSSPVYIENLATAALYYYTPYQPNAAAMRAGYGTGDSCSAYGNRNFYNYFTDWFGPTQVTAFADAAARIDGLPVVGQTLKAIGTFSPAATTMAYQWYRDGTAVNGATGGTFLVTSADSGRSIEVDVTARRPGYSDTVRRSPAVAVRNTMMDRLSGSGREETAVAVSRAAWPSGADTAFLAISTDFADALSASAVSGKTKASMLLTQGNSLSATVSAELTRLSPSRVVLAGGEGVLTPRLAQQVRDLLPGATVERIAGANRYATSQAIVASLGTSQSIFLATGEDFPDALSAAAVGNPREMPVLLVHGTSADATAETMKTIADAGVESVTIVGGPGAVSAGIESQLKSAGLKVTRLQGADRFLTNVAVNQAHFSTTTLRVLFATGRDFPDALSATGLAGRLDVPLVLTDTHCVPESALNFVLERKAEHITLIGGPGVLSQDGVERLTSC